MTMNHLGLTLAQLGPFADPTSVETMAVAAEARGYGSLWVIDRLLDPCRPAPNIRPRSTVRCPTSSASPSTL